MLQPVNLPNNSMNGGITVKLGPRPWIPSKCLEDMANVKEDHLEEDKNQFKDSGASITAEGKRHYGADVGTPQFISASPVISSCHPVTCTICCIHSWSEKLIDLSHQNYPHHLWSTPTAGGGDKAQTLTIFDREKSKNDVSRDFMARPVWHGILGIINPTRDKEILLSIAIKSRRKLWNSINLI